MKRAIGAVLFVPTIAIVLVVAYVGGALVWLANELIPLVMTLAKMGDGDDV